MIPGITPADLDLPAKFTSFRVGQTLALKRGLESKKRFVAHSMPVGEGKSLYYIAQALMSAKRALVNTSSKALQTQLLKDFKGVGLVDMRGRNNYQCINPKARSCEDGVHFHCPGAECGYEIARTKMLAAPLVVTNYSYSMLATMYGRGMGEFDLLILDEAHNAPDEVCKAVAVQFSYSDASKIGTRLPPATAELDDWKNWANEQYQVVSQKLGELEDIAEGERKRNGRPHPATSREVKAWTVIQSKISTVMEAIGHWVVSKIGDGYELEPVWAKDYAPLVLFRKIPKVVLTSASLVRKTTDFLGIPDDELDYFEYGSSFPKDRSPVYQTGHMGSTRLTIDNKANDGILALWMAKIDNIIRARLDRKGIIHSVSYPRAKFIHDNSDFSRYMIVPANGKETAEALEKFEAAEPPAILISPAITTGYDFAGSQCEYNIVAKVPFLDSRDPLTAARSKEDPEYAPYITAQTMVQALGRSMRAEWDQSEGFIVDAHIDWFIKKHHKLFPFWFHRLVSKPSGIPEPPAPLSKTVGNHPPSINQNEEPF